MNTAWKKIKLGDLLTIKHGWAFKGEYFCSEGELILLTPGNFHEEGGFKIQIGKEKFYSGTFPKEYLLKKDDLIIAMTEQGAGLLGSPAIVPQNDRFLHNQRLGLLQIDHQKAITKYIYYLFFTKEVRNSISSTATGTKVRHTAPKRIYNIDVNLPPLETQTQIANILSAYDDLIENNLRRIKLLEEMAELTYREWFVNFTIDGKTLEIDKNTGLPFGWEYKPAENIFNIKIGKTPPREEEEWFQKLPESIKWSSIKDINNSSVFILETNENITSVGVQRFNMNIAPKNTLILSFKLTVGKIAITTEQMVTNEAIAHFNIIDNATMTVEYIYCYLKCFNYDSLGSTSSIGTAINSKIVKSMPILQPTKEFIDEFDNIVKPIFKEILNLSHQNRLLKESRDILLPRLMSGEVLV